MLASKLMEGIVNKWGYIKRGKGQLASYLPMDTYGFELFDWSHCEDKSIKNHVCQFKILMVENEMSVDTCMWDVGKPSKKEKRKQKKSERKQERKQKQEIQKSSNSGKDQIAKIKRICDDLLRGKDGKVYQYDDYSLFVEDINNIQYDEWLSDSNISIFYSMITNGFLKDHRQVILLAPTFSFLLANCCPVLDVKDVMPKELFNSQVIFCPVNDNLDFGDVQGGSHWSMVVCLKDLGICIGVDSMKGANDTEMKRLTKQLSELFGEEFKYMECKDCPQQINGSDCGVIVLIVTLIYVDRLLQLGEDEVMNWDLTNVRVNPLACRLWMIETLKLLTKV